MSGIHKTAVVEDGARIAEGVKIGPYAVVEADVTIAQGCVVEAHAHMKNGARIAEDCRVCGFATISGPPQDLRFDEKTKSYVNIGRGTTIREGATIHRSTREGEATVIGENCFIMANAHVGHDCLVGDKVIIAPFAALGGFVLVGKDSFISGGVMIHQTLRVGQGVMLSGNSTFSMDVPPYVNCYKRNCIRGLNIVGLARRSTPRASMANLKEAFAAVYGEFGNVIQKAQAALDSGLAKSPEAEEFLKFFTELEGRRYVRPLKHDK